MVVVNKQNEDTEPTQKTKEELEQALTELRQYPKITRAELVGDGKTLLVETSEIYLLNDDKDRRSKMGRFLMLFHTDNIIVKNYTPIDQSQNKKKWMTGSTYRKAGNFDSVSDPMHHPHVTGNYVSLAQHEHDLFKAIRTEDWVAAVNIMLKFLQDYKFGDKAKKFFERHTEHKIEGEGWVLKAFDAKDFKSSDLSGSFTSGGSWSSSSSGPWQSAAIKELKRNAPIGTRIRLASHPYAYNSCDEGDEGVIEGYGEYNVIINWDNGKDWEPSAFQEDFEIVELPDGFDAKKHEELVDEQENKGEGPYSLYGHKGKEEWERGKGQFRGGTYLTTTELKKKQPIGSIIEIISSTLSSINPGDIAEIVDWETSGPRVQWLDENYGTEKANNNRGKLLSNAVDKWKVVRTPEPAKIGDKVMVTIPADWRHVSLEAGDMGIVQSVREGSKFHYEVAWETEGLTEHRKNQIKHARLEPDDQWGFIDTDTGEFRDRELIDVEDDASPLDIAGEDSVDAGSSDSWREYDLVQSCWVCTECREELFDNEKSCPECGAGEDEGDRDRPKAYACPQCNFEVYRSEDSCPCCHYDLNKANGEERDIAGTLSGGDLEGVEDGFPHGHGFGL